MDDFIARILFLHVISGTIALIAGAIALFTSKGKPWHKTCGKIYFWSMTSVFITGIIVAGYRFNRFLFLIAFLSYYTAFAGVRILKLKKLHKKQRPEWYDWVAGILNGLVNTVFVILGLSYFLPIGFVNSQSMALLSIGFGLGGIAISYVNIKPFIVKPTESYHWYLSHLGNMLGGYIATFTAFVSTISSRLDFSYPILAFISPAIIGIPLLIFWLNRQENKFKQVPQSYTKTELPI